MRALVALIAGLATPSPQASECVAESGEATVALVELYTSAGCSDCPAAERWLAALAARGTGVVPLSIAIDQGAPETWGRQRKMTPLQRLALLHRPYVLLQGRETSDWPGPAFERSLARIHAIPPRARLRLQVRAAGPDTLDVHAQAQLAAERAEQAVLYLAAYEAAPPFRASDWLGPFPLGASGQADQHVSLPAGPSRQRGGVVAFVQERRSLEVLQALALPLIRANCPTGKG